MSMPAEPVVEIQFDCLPLRLVPRVDVPLDASDHERRRAQRIKAAIDARGTERTYYLDNARCVYRFANSEIDGICRFQFEGVVLTDAGDHKCQEAILDVDLASDTCDGIPPAVVEWLAERVRQAVVIEFDRFIAAGELAKLDAEEDLGGI
jgi:hypothetical protein